MRVVITGIGSITPVGKTPKEVFSAVVNKQSGIREITTFPLDKQHLCRVAGEVDFDPGWLSRLLLGRLLRKDLKKIARASQFAMFAINHAITDAKLKYDRLDPHNAQRVGICMGASLIGMVDIIEEVGQYNKNGARWISPALIQKIMPNAAAARPSLHQEIHGPVYTTSAACATSAISMIDAYKMLADGECDGMITGGCEDAIDPISHASFGNLTALSTSWNDQPEKALRPCDLNRAGFVPGEGAVAFVFEELSHALARKARIYVEVAGYARNSDAHNIVHPHPEGTWQALCMSTALERAKIKPSELSYINAHGTGTPQGDPSECRAIISCMGTEAEKVPVSSTKGVTSHLMSSAAAVELLICVMAITQNVIPPTTNLEIVHPECTGISHVHEPINTKVESALNNSFGFGGENTCIVLKKFAA